MDWFLIVPVLIWLGILSWYDIQTREIPHSAWVTIPLTLVGMYRVWLGGWQLVLLAALVVAASERGWIAGKLICSKIAVLNWCILFIMANVWVASLISPIGAMAILGFWIAWELKWWGGADASCAITLFLLWPDAQFMLVFIVSHLIVILAWRLRNSRKRVSHLHQLPGLPILFVAVLIFLPQKLNFIHLRG